MCRGSGQGCKADPHPAPYGATEKRLKKPGGPFPDLEGSVALGHGLEGVPAALRFLAREVHAAAFAAPGAALLAHVEDFFRERGGDLHRAHRSVKERIGREDQMRRKGVKIHVEMGWEGV